MTDFVRMIDINRGVEMCRQTPGGVLLDVRTPDEYGAGHIPGSVNVPLDELEETVFDIVPDLDTPLFVYCLSGARSTQAVVALDELGYTNLNNIGGISFYRGETEK